MTRLRFLGLTLAVCACSSSGGSGNGGDGGTPPGTPDASYGACIASAAGGFTFEKIAIWRDDAKAAYSMIHDDMCGGGLRGIDQYAIPALESHGVVAGLGPIVAECEKAGLWDVVTDAEAHGNEIISHSYTHPEISVANAPHEVVDAKAAFDQHVAHPVTFYIFPYDFFTADTIAAVAAAGHIGARAGNRDDNDGFDKPPLNSPEPMNDLQIEFDVWPRTYSKYALYRAEEILAVHVWNAIEKGSWALREFHSVIPDDGDFNANGFGPVPLSMYERHLAFLVDAWKSNQVWTGTPSTIIKYRHARTACTASVANDTITFGTSAPDCTKFATPISVIVTTGNDVPRIDATQGGAPVATRKIGPSRFSVTADPTLGEVALSGCSNPGPTVDTSVMLAPKPQPAASVCDIETVTGAGTPGNMDNLERPADQFQVLPNPSQADGRTGTWSWYPQNVSVTQAADGATNHVLKYTGTAVAAWTGVTLAFLGGNGAGTCYDATAYQGVRFKIKGSVTATDELNGKVILSLVTAETQSRTYGGDLVGEGGHFHKVLTLTPDWQTVSLTWADFSVPTWGTTATLTQLAKAKLQALDWGVSNTASSFEIYLDDIELY